jgi:SAM-dependent methyltransferase
MSGNYESYWQTLQATHDLHPGNRLRYDLVLKFIKQFVREGSEVHDIGCGSGELLSRIRSARPDLRLSGSDISPTAVNLARMKGLDCFVADFSQGDVDSRLIQRFDVVILSEVIEHVQADLELLKTTATVLKRDGLLYLSTQAGRRYKMDQQVLGHLRHYTKSQLKLLFHNSGFKPLQISASGFPILTLQKLVVEIFYPIVVRTLGSKSRPGPLLSLAMKVAYIIMRLFSFPVGPQLMAVAVRSV